MLKFVEKDATTLNPMMKHIIMMLKYGKKSRNSCWAESNGTEDMVTRYYNSLSPEDTELLRDIFSKIGFRFDKSYDIIKFEKSIIYDDTLITEQQMEILETLFGDYSRRNIFMGDSFHIRCDKLLKKIARRNESDFDILDLVEEKI
jgi:hypothetical protein